VGCRGNAVARHQDVAQALAKFFNEDTGQKKKQKCPKPISFEYIIKIGKRLMHTIEGQITLGLSC